jgi:integrase
MPKKRPPYIETFVSRHGKRMWFFRVGKGPRVRLPDEYGSEAFQVAYRSALLASQATSGTQATRTLGWLIKQYCESPAWHGLAKETRKQFRYQLDRMKERAGKAPLNEITAASIAAGRDARAAKPTDANKYLKCSLALYRFAVDRQWMKDNPAKGIAKLKTPSIGFHTWTEEEAKNFEDRWPIGTRERLAFDLLIYTGVRRSDVVRLGRQHTKKGEITITTEKSRNSGRPVAVTITILQPLARSIAASQTGDMAYLVTAKGTPFGKESFGTLFKKACVAAGVPGSSHGLRKLAAVRMAENGATEAELNAVFGWAEGSDESATYIRKANRAKLARGGILKMISPEGSPNLSPNLKHQPTKTNT